MSERIITAADVKVGQRIRVERRYGVDGALVSHVAVYEGAVKAVEGSATVEFEGGGVVCIGDTGRTTATVTLLADAPPAYVDGGIYREGDGQLWYRRDGEFWYDDYHLTGLPLARLERVLVIPFPSDDDARSVYRVARVFRPDTTGARILDAVADAIREQGGAP